MPTRWTRACRWPRDALAASVLAVCLAVSGGCSSRLDLGSRPRDGGVDSDVDGEEDARPDADADEEDAEVAEADRDLPADGEADRDGSDAEAPPDGCPRPHLLVGVESFDGSSGRIARLVLGAEPPFERCPDLTGRSGLPSQPFAVADVPAFGPDRRRAVAAASWGEVAVVDAETDEVLWFDAYEPPLDGLFPVDVVSIVDPEALPLVVFAFADGPRHRIHTLHVYDAEARELAASTPLHGWVASVTASPLDETRLLGLLSSSYDAAAAEIDPWTGETSLSAPYVGYPTGRNLVTISTIRDGSENRTVWVGLRETLDLEDDDVLYHLNESTGASGQTLLGPTTCGDVPRAFHHAVPDPTDPDLYLALLDVSGTRSVVRLSSSAPPGSCETILAPPGEDARFAYLAVAQ